MTARGEISARKSLRYFLNHLGDVPDDRDPGKVRFPLKEVLFLVTCASMAGCEDYDEIVEWGRINRDFLRRHEEFYFGVPKADWLRTLMNRIDPDLFEACFHAWARNLRSDAPDIIALDGKSLRASADAPRGERACHLVSAWASTQRLVLAQRAVDGKTNECTAMLDLLARMSLDGALVTINAIATNPTVAQAIREAGGEYVLALKANQSTLKSEWRIISIGPTRTKSKRSKASRKTTAAWNSEPTASATMSIGSPGRGAIPANRACPGWPVSSRPQRAANRTELPGGFRIWETGAVGTNKVRKPYPAELRERAVRMVREQEAAYASRWAALTSITEKFGCSAETLRGWLRQAERDDGTAAGVTRAEQERVKQLERENKELRRANEILRKASAYFAQAELDRRNKT